MFIVKLVYFLVGMANLGIGFIGILLPGLPTTIFWIVAAYCFMRSSPRMQRWVYGQGRLGQVVEEVCEHRRISARSRRRALIGMWTAITVSVAIVNLAGPRPWLSLAIVAAGGVGTLCVMRALRLATPEEERTSDRVG